jgi:tRNA threonylcarbamoyladenosine biosynthesis protein TsaE
VASKVITTSSIEETKSLSQKIGARLKGGEVIELTSDLGGGKTTFVKGLAVGFGANEPVTSPTFTISNVYTRTDNLQIHHFDFYRLDSAGVVADELAEVVGDEKTVVVVEWGEIIHDVLPPDRMLVQIVATSENARQLHFSYPQPIEYLIEKL